MSTEVKAIPNMLRVFSDTYANLPVVGVKIEDLGYATDRLALYRWSGAAWGALTRYQGSGLAANIPNAANVPEGSLYYCTDTLVLKQVSGGAWINVYAQQIASGSYTGDNAAGRQITVGFIPKLVLIEGASSCKLFTLIPSQTIGHYDGVAYHTNPVAMVYIHAADGFVVDMGSNPGSNLLAAVYYYLAIG